MSDLVMLTDRCFRASQVVSVELYEPNSMADRMIDKPDTVRCIVHLVSGQKISVRDMSFSDLTAQIEHALRNQASGFQRLEQQIAAVSDKVNVLAEMYDELKESKN